MYVFYKCYNRWTRARVHDEGGGISHEEAEGQRARNRDERIRGTMDAGEDGR